MAKEISNYIWKDKKHHLWFPISFTTYYIEDERLMIKKGFFTTTIDETLLYRVLDLTFQQTFWGKIFGTGNIIIKAKADSTGEVVLENISKPMEVRSMLSKLVEESRDKRNVVGKEFYSSDHIDSDGDGICDFDE